MPDRSAVTAREREEFDRAFRALPDEIPKRDPVAEPIPSAEAILRKLRAGTLKAREFSVRLMTRDQARPALEAFLRRSRHEGCRAVRVIHGMGHRSPGGRSILRERVPEWLADWKPELVQRWEAARQRDGGEGALYVVLAPRRSR